MTERCPVEIYQALKAVPGLVKGRSTAKETEGVHSVDDPTLEQTLPHLPPMIAAMVKVQNYVGMRPQDVLNMRPCDIQRQGDIWIYVPYTHKTEHKGKTCKKAIGPRAQAILMPYLIDKQDTPEAFLFSPTDSENARKFTMRENRKTKVCPSQAKRNAQRKVSPKRTFADQYTNDSYRRAIHRACDQAGITHWSPNQLRHKAGTDARDKFGLDAAQAYLGHSNAKTTEIYAELNFEKAAMVAREIG